MDIVHTNNVGSLRAIPVRAAVAFAKSLLMLVGLSGCAALTNPVADGVPAQLVTPALLAEPKDPKVPVPLTLLRREPQAEYKLAAGDILGVYVQGVLGEQGQAPPVNIAEGLEQDPSLGFPIPIRDDGTLSLPLVAPVSVEGMSLEEAEQAIIRAYSSLRPPILQPGRERVLVTLVRPRQTRVLVIRQDSPGGGIPIRLPGTVRSTREFRGGAEAIFRTTNGTGSIVFLPAYHNDVLNALAQTGGLPGLDAENEIVIQRGRLDMEELSADPSFSDRIVDIPAEVGGFGGEVLRIPLRIAPGQPFPFSRDDIVLRDGDVVLIQARDTEVFYTGGLLPSGEYPLPRDYDLDVVEAVLQVGGPLINGGINSNNLSGALVEGGLGSPSPRLLTVLRPMPNGGRLPIIVDMNTALTQAGESLIVKPGDVLILQETRRQALARYMSRAFNFLAIGEIFSNSAGTSVGTAALTVP